jgi:hypothetical protein
LLFGVLNGGLYKYRERMPEAQKKQLDDLQAAAKKKAEDRKKK